MQRRRATTIGVHLLPGRDRTNENGLTLIELLVTVVIMGLTFVIILGGMSTAILGSDVHHRQVTADAVLRSAADMVRSDETDYEDCATTYDFLDVDPAGYTRAPVTVVGYWDSSSNKFESPVAYNCTLIEPAPSGSKNDNGLQLLELSVTASARSVTEKMQIVKRAP